MTDENKNDENKKKTENPTPEVAGAEPETSPVAEEDRTAIDMVVRTLALLVFNSVRSLWISANDLTETVAQRFEAVRDAVDQHGEIRFAMSNETLLVNGMPVEIEGHHLEAFVEQLSTLEVSTFSLVRGLSMLEFLELLDLLAATPLEIQKYGGFNDAVAQRGLVGVIARKMVLKEVGEDDVVVGQRLIEAEKAVKKEKAGVGMLTYLSGDDAAPSEESVDHLHEIANDPKKMAEIIFEATKLRQQGKIPERVIAGGEAAAEAGEGAGGDGTGEPGEAPEKRVVVVDCLRRAFDGLMKHPSVRTKKGKKAVEKTLKALEKELLASIDAEQEKDVADAICETVEHMIEGLKTEAIASDYARKLKALEDSEKRILRFMKSQGLQRVKNGDLEDQLSDGGLDVSGWHKLLAKSEDAVESEEEVFTKYSSANAVTNLAKLLGQLEDSIKDTRGDAGPQGTGTEQEEKTATELTSDLEEANRQVNSLVSKTEKKIEDLVHNVNSDIDEIDAQERAAKKAGHGPNMSRKTLLVVLAEVVQELYQPLSVISCSINMVTSNMLGEVTQGQMDMLVMANQSVERVQTLIHGLCKISGMPSELSPVEATLDAVYSGKSEVGGDSGVIG